MANDSIKVWWHFLGASSGFRIVSDHAPTMDEFRITKCPGSCYVYTGEGGVVLEIHVDIHTCSLCRCELGLRIGCAHRMHIGGHGKDLRALSPDGAN